MLDSYSTNATATKIRAVHSNMFNKDNYHEMLSRKSVPEIAEYLAGSKRFREAFRGVDPNTVHRGFLEELLYRENFNTYVRLCRFQGLDKKPFYDYLIKLRETECILSMINSINSQVSGGSYYLKSLPGYVIKHSNINLLELSRAENYEELLKFLRGTPYYKVLVKIPSLDDGRADYTKCEVRLRTFYYEQLIDEVQKDFSHKESEELRSMIIKEINMKNVINAYRMKAFFNYTVDHILTDSIRVTGMSMKRFETYCSCESAEQMLEKLEKTLCVQADSDTALVETAINRKKYSMLCHVIARSVSAPVSLYAFMQLCDIEVKNIIHIIEGIRYGVDSSVIESKLLIC